MGEGLILEVGCWMLDARFWGVKQTKLRQGVGKTFDKFRVESSNQHP